MVNKPAGLLAVPGRGVDKQDSLVSRVQAEFSDALIVHRLDMATSGIIVFARGAGMQSSLSRIFRERLVAKRYMAVVAGNMPPPSQPSPIGRRDERALPFLGMDQNWFEINLPLIGDWPNRPKQKVDSIIGKPSLTRYRLLGHDAGTNTSRMELEPVTGRTHQLRVHMAAIGHPVVGDILYGGYEAERLMLHACSLSFAHPLSGKMLCLSCEPPF